MATNQAHQHVSSEPPDGTPHRGSSCGASWKDGLASNGVTHKCARARGERPDLSNEPMYRRSYRTARRLWLRAKKPWIARRLRAETSEEVDGVHLVIPPGVHNPVVFRAGVLLARTTARHIDHGSPDVLDMGTGSGIAAIYAARSGSRVHAVDINPNAVECARGNVVRNGVDANVTVLEGDLFAPVRGLKFDLVLFNPPFHIGSPRNVSDMAWRGVDTVQRFAMELPDVLKTRGRALLVFSSDGDEAALHEALEQSDCHVDVLDWQDLGNEVLTVYTMTRREDR